MKRLFRLEELGTSVSKEVLCGATTFLTMSYILFVNPAILAESGMPAQAVFAATALTAALCSAMMGLYANAPFGMAPGMGLNTFFTYVICTAMGFHWQEGLALVFVGGAIHFLIMATGLRKSLVNAIPHHLKMAFGVGLGIFIGYVGLKSSGLLMFTTPPGQYLILESGTVISNSSAVPSLIDSIGAGQMVALAGLGVMIFFLALERKTGDNYAALPVGIIAAAFIGIPLGVTNLSGGKFIDFGALGDLGQVFFSLWGEPGLLSVLTSPDKILLSALIILVLLVTNVMDSVGTIIGIGQVQGAEVFTEEDMRRFADKKASTRLDRCLLCNSLGGSLGALMGTTTCTTYMESITGIVAGGRSGLAALTVGGMFLLCLPLAGFFSLIPAQSIAPALIVAGAFMMPLAGRINWHSFEEAFPAFITVACIPLTYGFVHGIAAGVLTHVVIQIAMGKWRKVHPMLYAIACIFILVLGAENWL